MELAVGAVVRNEAQYLLEWIAWHRMLGIRHFYLCDNASDDGTTELLADLDRAGIVHHIPFPDVPHQRPQMRAYAHILHILPPTIEWLAFIDVDEFIQLTGNLSLSENLAGQQQSVGAVLMNWAIFGSSGLTDPDEPVRPSPTLERFQRRAPQQFAFNAEVKSFLRPTAVTDSVGTTAHYLPLRPGFTYAQPNGETLTVDPDGSINVTAPKVDWSVLRLNHYMVRTRAEYLFKKRARGDSFFTEPRARSHFDVMDRNEIFDPVAPELLAHLRSGISELIELIDPAWQPAPIHTANSTVIAIDRLLWDETQRLLVLDGLYVDQDGAATIGQFGLGLKLGGTVLRPERIELFEHYNRAQTNPLAQALSGWRAWFSYPSGDVPERIEVVSGYATVTLADVTTLARRAPVPPILSVKPLFPERSMRRLPSILRRAK